ncbi:hypothetical protein T11_7528 [Trichinella zimbabwensis]|uniref:Uncharacterized protein n=1 Tax=Trichinella zimbabwensis TaxID=268475 RepID=A0A0V1HNB7_9BILA|nr:hypothetical protein T11_7528 [Trichinella zimbabwensis]
MQFAGVGHECHLLNFVLADLQHHLIFKKRISYLTLQTIFKTMLDSLLICDHRIKYLKSVVKLSVKGISVE